MQIPFPPRGSHFLAGKPLLQPPQEETNISFGSVGVPHSVVFVQNFYQEVTRLSNVTASQN